MSSVVGDLAERLRSHWLALFALTLALAMVVALLPPGDGPDWFWQADKVRHIGAFMSLWWVGRHVRNFSALVLALTLLSFGIAIEVAQSLTSYREASAADVLADLVGILLAASIWRLPFRRPAT